MNRTGLNIYVAGIDPELGTIYIRINPRAKNIVMRMNPEGPLITVPPGTEKATINDCIERSRTRLLTMRKHCPNDTIDLSFGIDTDLFGLRLLTGRLPHFVARHEAGTTTIYCPPNTHFENGQVQTVLHKIIRECLRKNAQALLPGRLQQLAQTWKLTYKQVHICASKKQWGSCSSQKHISLSLNLLLLPPHLVDYVLLHELAHTVEMNHSQRFWALLNKMTDGKANELRQELKDHRTLF